MLVIYVLKCPRTGRVRYVGKTGYPLQWRLTAHIYDANNMRTGRRGTWLRALLRDGLKPIIELDRVVLDGESWQQIERERIVHYRSMGCDLVNGTEGGDGLCEPSADVRARLSEAMKAFLSTPEGRAKARQGGLTSGPKNKGKKRTAEQRARISAGHTGRIVSAETRSRMSAAQRKRTDNRKGRWSDESRKRMSERVKAQHKAKMLDELARLPGTEV